MALTRLLIGTPKGAFFISGDRARRKWTVSRPQFLGHIVHHLVLAPRNRKTMLASARTGHLGPNVFRSTDRGRSWKEAEHPPAFPKAGRGKSVRTLNHVFWLTPGQADDSGIWYAGSSPPGTVPVRRRGSKLAGRSRVQRASETFRLGGWRSGRNTGRAENAFDPDRSAGFQPHTGMSSGGVFESTNGGADWKPLNAGCAADFIPTPDPEYGHDPHNLQLHPLQPGRLCQQNHCGIYRMDRSEGRWKRIGERMPKSIGDIGFPILLDPRDPEWVWVFPMDGTSVWPRTNPGGRPALYRTANGGKTWKRLDK
jgi:hypothetical protein